ncbi:uncharacterized protein LOC134234617 [Saccostrea cucullata]|uniref:uncharacterized protein LOC134234617 n=1 Tax=Saccostrea cuccullata TaxID=36930 RepID=UPI002ED5D363
MFTYDLNDWVIVDEKSDGWREIPVHWPALPIPKVLKYQVITYLGDVHKAGTDSNVFVCLYGSLGSSGKRLLKHSLTNKDRFTQDQVDQFEIEAVDLGTLQKVVIGHDSLGEGSGWYLKKVVVMDSIDSVDKFVFPCNHWLDEGEEDAKIERTLLLSEEVVFEDDMPPTPQVKSPSPVARQKSVTPAPREKTKTPTPTPRQKTKTPTPVPREKSKSPEPTPQEKAKTPSPPPKQKTKSPSPPPKQKTKSPSPPPLESPSPTLVVASEDVSDKVDSPKPASPEQEKTASPGVGDDKPVSPKPSEEKPEPPSNEEEKVNKSDTPEDEEPTSEIPEKIDTVKPEDLESKPETRDDKPDEMEVTAEQTDQQTAELEKAVEENKPATPEPQEGTVKVYVTTSAAPDCGTNDQVTLTVYGDAGNSGPLSLGEPNKGYFQPGQTDEFLVNFDTEELGGIRKIRIEHDNPHTQSGWGLDKVILHNLKSDERYEFHVGKLLSFSGEYGDIAVEVPAENDSHDFWPVRHYVVAVETGTEENSGTDATVHITLFGTLGDTGRRYLINNKEQNKKFRTGKVDTFIVEAVDLGRLENIIIGHDGKGSEGAWFLEKVSVKEGVDAKHKYIFTCNSWLQDEEDYGIVEVELYMDRMEKENSNLQKQNLNTVDGEESKADGGEESKGEGGEESKGEGGEQGKGEGTNEDMRSIEGGGIKEDEVTDTKKDEEIKDSATESRQDEGVTEDTNKTEDQKIINEDNKSGVEDKTKSENKNSVPEDHDVDVNKNESKEKTESESKNSVPEDHDVDVNKNQSEDKTESGNQNKINEDDIDNDKINEDMSKTRNGDQREVTEDINVDSKTESEDKQKTESEDTKKTESEDTKKTESEDKNKTESEDQNKATEDKN